MLRYRWLVTGMAVLHKGPYYPPLVTLALAPLGTVSTVVLRYGALTTEATSLVLGTDYEVESAAEAILRVTLYRWRYGYYDQPRVEVSYTLPDNGPIPEDAERACTQTVASWTAPTLPAGSLSGAGGTIAAAAAGIKRYSVGQELTVEYAERRSGETGSAGLPAPLPSSAIGLLAPYGYPAAGSVVLA